jgi:FkbM family methyltransferase
MRWFSFGQTEPVNATSAACLHGSVATWSDGDRTLRFFVANPNDVIQRHHLMGEFYEKEELEIITSHWCPGGTVLDIGANVGNHTVFMSKYLSAKQIFVFEPNPPVAAVLQINILLNQCSNVDVRFLGKALGATDQRVSLVLPPRTRAGLENLGGTSVASDPKGSVAMVTGDSLLAGEHVNFIKIDVEGLEMEVLDGLQNTISLGRPNIFIEVMQANEDALFEWMTRNAYKIIAQYSRYDRIVNYMLIPT